ncbi:hypothetical protein D7V93_26880 [Corallococcus llansteffanensis]|uniref:WD40 repeat domain-containing protein n=2 Tax=Corallococcus llansteffanensis TaxID=2316731 RepID=A0A3A8PA34_9BACT|nr:hypothetical protein D7V93_26880 [Corallococcus llansteffanensis]
MGLTACPGDPDGGMDAGTEVDAGESFDAGETVDGGAPVQTLMEAALLWDVDVQQRFLVAQEAGGGMVVQDLASGEVRTVAPPVEGLRFTADGSALLLWSAQAEGLRSAWLWRPGDSQAFLLSDHMQGYILMQEHGERYLSFIEQTPEGDSDVRVVDLDGCTAQACSKRTLLRVLEGVPALHAGARYLWAWQGERTWIIDLVLGTVQDLGMPRSQLRISPAGSRFGVLTPKQNVQVYDTATGAQLWEVPVEGTWVSLSASFFNEDTVTVNVRGVQGPYESFPPVRSFSCTARGCTTLSWAKTCETFATRTQPLLFCSGVDCFGVRCSASYTLLKGAGEELANGGFIDTLPAVSDDLRTSVWMTYSYIVDRERRTLSWAPHDAGGSSGVLRYPGQISVNLFEFIPGEQRFVFLNPKQTPVGATEYFVSVWDGKTLQEVAPIASPHVRHVVRGQPAALYMNETVTDPDGTSRVRIRRFAL